MQLREAKKTPKGPGKEREAAGFQKDILPTLASLLRHEVQRQRAVVSPPSPTPATIACSLLVQQLIYIKVVAMDDQSLKGWGKTTRRPRILVR
ncbi:hypothetical protein WN944_003069 [Citrus x changshan-huyou]|uniref:Uncharacterized protein n=1 Tax=Citrus x changshan-huyou TaxID=2935761 RepID=A0AAP0M2G7_9ROSI